MVWEASVTDSPNKIRTISRSKISLLTNLLDDVAYFQHTERRTMSRNHAPRHIQLVLDQSAGKVLDADVVFADQYKREAAIFQLRKDVEEGIQRKAPHYVCTECKTPITVRARVRHGGTHWYFQHLRDSPECSIKTKHHLTKEQIYRIQYNGLKEGDKHSELKHFIGHTLQKQSDVLAVRIDKVYKDRAVSTDWRKPDVLAQFPDKRIAFELQISKDFLSVIVARTIFYAERGIQLIWVFANFSTDEEQHLFFQKDVYYNRNFNLFVLDNDAMSTSKEQGRLVLKCFHQRFHLDGLEIHHSWHYQLAALDELTYRTDPADVFLYDSGDEKKRLEGELAKRMEIAIMEEEASRRKQEQEQEEAVANEQRERSQRQFRRAVEHAVQFVKDGYHRGFFPPPGHDHDPIPSMNVDMVQSFNDKLGFRDKNIDWVGRLLEKRDKPFVIEYFFNTDNIWINTAELRINGEPVLHYLLRLPWTDFQRYGTCLFRKGYYPTEADKNLLESIRSENILRSSHEQKEALRKWGYAWLLHRWPDPFRIKAIQSSAEQLLALLSLKIGSCIYHDFNNLRELTHNVLEYHRDIGDLYLKAMLVYGQDKIQYAEDRNGSIQGKVNRYYMLKPLQSPRVTRLAQALFPELN